MSHNFYQLNHTMYVHADVGICSQFSKPHYFSKQFPPPTGWFKKVGYKCIEFLDLNKKISTTREILCLPFECRSSYNFLKKFKSGHSFFCTAQVAKHSNKILKMVWLLLILIITKIWWWWQRWWSDDNNEFCNFLNYRER